MDIGTYLKHFSDDPRISCKQWCSRSVLPPQALFFVRYVGTSVLLKLKSRFLISVPISAGMHILFHWFLNLGKLYFCLTFFTRWDSWIHWKPFFFFFQDLNSPLYLLFHSEYLHFFFFFVQACISCWGWKVLNINLILTTKIPNISWLT